MVQGAYTKLIRPTAPPAEFRNTLAAYPELAAIASVEVTTAGRTIYAEGGPAGFIYTVALGIVRTVRLTPEGRRIVLNFHVPHDVFGIEHDGVYTCSAEAIGEVRLIRCDRGRLEALAARDGSVGRQFWSCLLFKQERAERLSLLGRQSAITKIGCFLLDLAERMAVGRQLELPMSRYDIGDYLGLSSETVSRAFTVLRQKGLIATRGHSVFLLNVKALRRLNPDFTGPQLH